MLPQSRQVATQKSTQRALQLFVLVAQLPVLVVQLLGATPFEVGTVNAAHFLPYAVLGLIAGVHVDRWRRKPVLV